MLSDSQCCEDEVNHDGGVFEIFNEQCVLFDVGEYSNELETVRKIQQIPAKTAEFCRLTNLGWLNRKESDLEEKRRVNAAKSLSFRKKGNEILKDTTQAKRINWYAAAEEYTNAIVYAPPKSEVLALSHANRAMVLQKIGYYQQAYDDSVCALENGCYPKALRHKVWLRQAHCAWHSGLPKRLEAHLNDLSQENIDERFSKEVEELRRKHQLLALNDELSTTDTIDAENVDLHRESQKIIETPKPLGRKLAPPNRLGRKSLSMVATQTIKKGELIFTERVSSFVPIKGNHICQQCARTQIIIFPCPNCFGQVVYCSVKCRNKHEPIHVYECAAYQKRIVHRIGIGHLALRVMLDGLIHSNILLHLRQFSSAKEIWSELVGDGSGVRKHAPAYAESLRMVTNLEAMAAEGDIKIFALLATLLTTYLKEFTTFFDQMEVAAADKKEWELVTAALLLRHIAQLTCNAHMSMSLMPFNKFDTVSYPLLTTPLYWEAPFRIKRGYLHILDNIEPLAAMNLPYFSICNHSCEQFVQPKYAGRHVHVYACKTITANEEIFNSYTLDCRKSKWTQRHTTLRNTFKFDCSCVRCQQPNPDEEYEKFHKYWCGHCHRYFTPKSELRQTHEWWETGLEKLTHLNCSYCGRAHSLSWAHDMFDKLQDRNPNFKDRFRIYNNFFRLENWVSYYHKLRLLFACKVAKRYFRAHEADELQLDEYPRLVHLLKLCLDGVVEEGQKISIEYAAQMTYLWDLIAVKKYKCDTMEMDALLTPLEAISDENKVLFMNYYDDYIKPLLE